LLSWKVLPHTNSFVMISFVLLLIQGHVCCVRTRMDLLPWVGHVCVVEYRLRSACWIVEQMLITWTRQDAVHWTLRLSKEVPIWFRWGLYMPSVPINWLVCNDIRLVIVFWKVLTCRCKIVWEFIQWL
jgi:hypothetical protein